MPFDLIYPALGVLAFLTLVYIGFLHRKVNLFLRGQNAKTLEDTIRILLKSNEALIEEVKKLRDRAETLERKMRKSIRTVETVRFNPFSDAGSNQSFATSFTNEEGDGVVLSSLYSRDRVSVFAKPVKKNDSEYGLTDEERTVIKKSSEQYSQE
jgi:hypothetical protein